MTQSNRLWVLLSRRLSGEGTPAEAEELGLLLEESPEKQYLLTILHSYFAVFPAGEDVFLSAGEKDGELMDAEQEKRFRKILEASVAGSYPGAGDADQDSATNQGEDLRPVAPVFRLPLRKIAVYAASVSAVFLLGWAIWRLPHTSDASAATRTVKGEEVQARAGARTRMVLPDGTQVWLNSNSKLKYNNEFNAGVREVGLEGEAFFEVAKDLQHPFIVHTSSLDIKVLGTAFTVKSYPQDETVEATLLRGAIEVTRKDNPNTPRVILKPNEKLVFSKRLPVIAKPGRSTDPVIARPPGATPDMAVNSIRLDIPDSNKIETAWMYNRLVFSGDTFKELALKMERWYNVKITIRDESLGRCRFAGAFANETVEDAFRALQLTTDFNYKINGNEIELYAKK